MSCYRLFKSVAVFFFAMLMLVGVFESNGQAASLGHYAPSVFNIRDYFLPEEGYYFAQYTPFYHSNTYHDSSGDKVDSIVINPGPGPGVKIDVNAKVNMIVVAPVLIASTDFKILGARYGAFINPTLANSSLSATLTTQTLGGFSSTQANYGWGDMLIQPIWLLWSTEHFDIDLAEGFYAPVGKYDTTKVTVGSNTVTVPSSSNVGLGFWTNQIQTGAAWYPFDNKGTAVVGALTWEVNSKMEHVDLTPGQRLAVNWGASQYLPVTHDQSRLVEVGLTGYDQWQITNDSGSESNNVNDQVHAVGGQLGLTIVPSSVSINFRYLHEYSARDRFMGDWYNLSFAVKAF
jgi:hypothetical protein